MLEFTQPQNRENEIDAVLHGYRSMIGHEGWLAEAFQKDGIQNSWDARKDKEHGKHWSCTLFYRNPTPELFFAGIIDSGTVGLTGDIPKSEEELIEILGRDDPERKQRLSAFLGSDWSSKGAGGDLGSRGRGKKLLIGSSENKTFYFDSYREDGIYVSGKMWLDPRTKKIEIRYDASKEYLKRLEEEFKIVLPPLIEHGTRILIESPSRELVQRFIDSSLPTYVQSTWWEILHKFGADIKIEIDGKLTKVPSSGFLPVENLGVSEIKKIGPFTLPESKNLEVEKIQLCFIGDKDIPSDYKGLSVQRGGMSVQRLLTEIMDSSITEKIYGAVELGEELEGLVKENEGPEHYDIYWSVTELKKLKKFLKEEVSKFAREMGLVEESTISKKSRQAELASEKRINNLARKLGLEGAGRKKKKEGKRGKRGEDFPVRLSLTEFSTPYENGRVDYGDYVKGLQVTPINDLDKPLKVLVRVSINRFGVPLLEGTVRYLDEIELLLRTGTGEVLGWEELEISRKRFLKGEYVFRGELISMEERRDVKAEELGIRKEQKSPEYLEKGDKIYEINRSFYVEEDPPEKGMFKIEGIESEDRSRFFEWDESSEQNSGWIIKWNAKHPVFALADKRGGGDLEFEIDRAALLALYAVAFSLDKEKIDNGGKPLVFNRSDIAGGGFESIFRKVVSMQSSILWERAERK